jgi:RimJ/RimL family protein N-acetyltransferase
MAQAGARNQLAMARAKQGQVALRAVQEADLDLFLAMERDPAVSQMAAFGPELPTDRETYAKRLQHMRQHPAILRTILLDDEPAGYVMKFEMLDAPHVGYTIRQALWGRGIATRALALLLAEVEERPLYARAARTISARAGCWKSAVLCSKGTLSILRERAVKIPPK